MAGSTADQLAADITRRAADAWLFAGVNACSGPATNLTQIWSSDSGFHNDTDRSDSDYPARFSVNRQQHVYSKPGVSPTDTQWWYVAQLDPTVDIDCAVIANHNFHNGSGTSNFYQITLADNNDFTTGSVNISSGFLTWTSTIQNTRVVDLDVNNGSGNAKKYSGYSFAKLLVNSTGGSPPDWIPELGELFLGTQRLMFDRPLTPHDAFDRKDLIFEYTSDGGTSQAYVQRSDQRGWNVNFLTGDATEVARIQSLWGDITGGKHFWTWNAPGTSPGLAYNVKLQRSAISMPLWDENAQVYRWSEAFEELPPYVSEEGLE